MYDGKARDGFDLELNDDRDLEKIGNNYTDKYIWENNNWFEVIHADTGESSGEVSYDYDEAIEMLKSHHKEQVYE